MPPHTDLLVLTRRQVHDALAGQETRILDAVRGAYEAHARGETALPHSSFLRFPAQPRDRIIALPAYLGDGGRVAGIKWIASFPGNLERGLERASAVVVLNSVETGHAQALIEGSLISAKRTAAGAALAARLVHGEALEGAVGLVGCGAINLEILRFLRSVYGRVPALVYDLDPQRAAQFARACAELAGGGGAGVAASLDDVLTATALVSFATTAVTPHVARLPERAPATILHISLRDLAPEIILAADNVVDDADHVCRADTSVHLAERASGSRAFIRASLGELLLGRAAARGGARTSIVSPFGLGILDLAVSRLALELAVARGTYATIPEFAAQE